MTDSDTVSERRLIYICGPISGYPDLNIAGFSRAEKFLIERNYAPLNPHRVEDDNPTPGTPQTWDWYMRRTIAMMLKADGVATLDDWTSSSGSVLEVHIAHALRIPVLPVFKWPLRG